MNYKALSKSMAPDVADYILINHKKEIKEMYSKFIHEFLNDKGLKRALTRYAYTRRPVRRAPGRRKTRGSVPRVSEAPPASAGGGGAPRA